MLMIRADREMLERLLVSKGVYPPEGAEYDELPLCRVFRLNWNDMFGGHKARLFTSSHLPVLLFDAMRLPVTIDELYRLDMIEEKEDDL